MTNERAIELFKEVKAECEAKQTILSKQVFEHEGIEALDMAIKALEQQQNIITQIEQARDKDKNCGEYPYNRCIEIIKGVNNGLH